jgi:hypothetical protein
MDILLQVIEISLTHYHLHRYRTLDMFSRTLCILSLSFVALKVNGQQPLGNLIYKIRFYIIHSHPVSIRGPLVPHLNTIVTPTITCA